MKSYLNFNTMLVKMTTNVCLYSKKLKKYFLLKQRVTYSNHRPHEARVNIHKHYILPTQ